jgi:hypothetical protein
MISTLVWLKNKQTSKKNCFGLFGVGRFWKGKELLKGEELLKGKE